jgi:CRP/FNR family transcriptional regulator, anaerobic regulatory protein
MNSVLDDTEKPLETFSQPMHRFNEYVAFTPLEMEEIRALGDKPVALPRLSVIREQEVCPTCLFVLLEGWDSAAVRYENGNQQITKIHLPGDLMGSPNVSLALTADFLTALTPVVVSRIPIKRFAQLFAASPRFAAAMFLSAQRERVALIDSLTRIGRTSSSERLAALLLDFYERLSDAGYAQDLQLELPITQEVIADVLGLSLVHVSRSFKKIEDLGLVLRTSKLIQIADLQALRVYARWQDRPKSLQANLFVDRDCGDSS